MSKIYTTKWKYQNLVRRGKQGLPLISEGKFPEHAAWNYKEKEQNIPGNELFLEMFKICRSMQDTPSEGHEEVQNDGQYFNSVSHRFGSKASEKISREPHFT